MTRSVLAVAALVVEALLGAWAAWVMYDLAAVYADPVGSALDLVRSFGIVWLVALVVLVAAALAAVGIARASLRRIVRLSGGAAVLGSLCGMFVAGHYGLEAKKVESARPPRCGVGNEALDREFRVIDHPGYFGGGSSSRSECSFTLTAKRLDAALDAYADGLTARGYDVSRSSSGITAVRDGLSFSARVEEAFRGRDYLTVTLRAAGSVR